MSKTAESPNKIVFTISAVSIALNTPLLLLAYFAKDYGPTTILAAIMVLLELVFIVVGAWGVFSFKGKYVLVPLIALVLSFVSFGLLYSAFENVTL